MKTSHILALLSLIIVASTLRVDARTWTDSRGRTIKADYVSCHNGIVRMKNSAGKTHRVPMWKLSQQAHRQANVKASLDVRLAERVSKAKLTAIANELQGFADNKQPSIFIVYYLPNMKIDAGGWATSHFNPKLEIKILGTTKEEHARLRKEVSTPIGNNVIGRWMDKTAFPGVITFLRKDGKVFKTKTFQDGSKGEYEMVVRKVGSQTRYSEKDSKTSDYVIIKTNGDLAHGDDEGLWGTSPKIK